MHSLLFSRRNFGRMLLEWVEWRWRWTFAHIGLLLYFCGYFSFTTYSFELLIMSRVSDIFLIVCFELLPWFILSLIFLGIFLAIYSKVIGIFCRHYCGKELQAEYRKWPTKRRRRLLENEILNYCKIIISWNAKFSGYLWNFRSFISAFSICMTVPLNNENLNK